MTDGDSLRRAAEGCDVVVHLVAGKLGLPAEFQNKMAQATKNLIGAAKDAGVQRFVLMSSLGTDERTAGLTAYSRAKWEAQQALQASGLEWTVFKPSFVFGPDGGMLPDFKKLGRMTLIVVPGNGKRRLQPIWVDDVASYYAESVDLPGRRTASSSSAAPTRSRGTSSGSACSAPSASAGGSCTSQCR